MYIKTILLGTLGYIVEYWRVLLRALFVPFVLYTTLDAMDFFKPDPTARVAVLIAGLIVQTLFAVTTHRIMLLGPNQVPRWGILSWSRRETLFALNIIRLGLIVVPLILLAYIPTIGLALAIALMLWIFSRLSLIFPAIAIDHPLPLKTAWQLTARYQLLMSFVVIILPTILAVPIYLLADVPGAFLITSFLSSLTTVITVIALSVAYRIIQRDTRDPSL